MSAVLLDCSNGDDNRGVFIEFADIFPGGFYKFHLNLSFFVKTSNTAR
jgi:hypothetical protein